MSTTHDYLIIGSGAGGAAAAYRLGTAGARVLVLEKGDPLPKDGSTLDPDLVIRQGAFLSREPWLDRNDQTFYPEEHFNGFASLRGLKSDAETCLLDRAGATVEVHTGSPVASLIPDPGDPRRVRGVVCADGSQHRAETVLLGAGALHSPRLLQGYLEDTRLGDSLPCAAQVGRYYKCHVLTVLLAFGHRPVRDLLCKTALLLHDNLPHSSVQTLGGNLAGEIVRAQAPRFARGVAGPVARRAYGFFLQTEDGSHPDNRVLRGPGGTPQLDHDWARLPKARDEHRRLARTLSARLLQLGYLPVVKPISLAGTAHACGTLVAGVDPSRSVVNAEGRVHGMDNLFVVDGSILPRSSRVNPALTIFAWALRVADRLAETGAVRPAEQAAA